MDPTDRQYNTNIKSSVISDNITMKSTSTQLSTLSDGCYRLTQKDLFSNGFHNFHEMRKSGKLCDICVKVGDQSFMAHKVVLSATVPYFYSMFMSAMNETIEREVKIRDTIEASAMKALLDFVYTGQIDITPSNAQSLLIGSAFLQLIVVRDACSQCLKTGLNINNVFRIKSFGDSFGCHSLVEASNEFIEKHFKEISNLKEFFELEFKQIHEIVSKDTLNVCGDEELVFKSVMDWIKSDIKSRVQYLEQLLSVIRLPLLSFDFLTTNVRTEELIRSSHSCRDLVEEAILYHVIPQKRPLLERFKTRQRYSNIPGLMYVIINNTDINVYNTETKCWEVIKVMTTLRNAFYTAFDNKLYAIGGLVCNESFNTVEAFDPKTKSWSEFSPMLSKRSYCGATAMDNSLYVCGGYVVPHTEQSYLNSVECYSVERNEWSAVTPMSTNRYLLGVVALNGYIYAIGGHNGSSSLDSMERFDPQTSEWTPCPPMLTKRYCLGATALKGRIYVCGGCNLSSTLKTAEVFDPKTQKWTFIAPMNVERSYVTLVAYCGLLYAIVGNDGALISQFVRFHSSEKTPPLISRYKTTPSQQFRYKSPLFVTKNGNTFFKSGKTVEVYDCEENKWEFIAPMPSFGRQRGVGVIPLQ